MTIPPQLWSSLSPDEKRSRAMEVASDLFGREGLDVTMPDLADFEPSPGVRDKPSRFAARVELEQADTVGVAPRTREALGDQMLGVGGSYRVTGNLDVTAGIRYSQERDRLVPLTDSVQDSQAVYIGTQFRF